MQYNAKPESIFFVGITGGSCACKSTFARRLRDALGQDNCRILCQDSYYRDQSDHFDFDGGAVNFDAPDSIDFELLHQQLLELRQGHAIHVPIYDFATHKRAVETELLLPAKVILLEGALILTQPEIVKLLAESVFLDIPEATRLERRIARDMVERGRTREGILKQFYNHVKPMHDRYIEPSTPLATYVVTSDADFEKTVQALVKKLGIDS